MGSVMRFDSSTRHVGHKYADERIAKRAQRRRDKREWQRELAYDICVAEVYAAMKAGEITETEALDCFVGLAMVHYRPTLDALAEL